MNKYLVTGGAGFIGSHIVDALIRGGDEVVILDNLSSGDLKNVNPKAKFVEGDVLDRPLLDRITKNIKGIFHCAAIVSVQYSLEHPEETERVNVGGTRNIIDAAEGNDVERIVFSSSAAVYGNGSNSAITENFSASPISPYGSHKLASEEAILKSTKSGKVQGVCLRYFNVYGTRQRDDSPYSGVIARFIRLKKEGKSLTVFGDGSQTRDFVHVRDIVKANILAMNTDGISGEIFNVGSGVGTSVSQLAKIIGGNIEYLSARNEIRFSLADISKARKILNWNPEVSLENGITEILDN